MAEVSSLDTQYGDSEKLSPEVMPTVAGVITAQPDMTVAEYEHLVTRDDAPTIIDELVWQLDQLCRYKNRNEVMLENLKIYRTRSAQDYKRNLITQLEHELRKKRFNKIAKIYVARRKRLKEAIDGHCYTLDDYKERALEPAKTALYNDAEMARLNYA